jgi:hypothetical protein
MRSINKPWFSKRLHDDADPLFFSAAAGRKSREALRR